MILVSFNYLNEEHSSTEYGKPRGRAISGLNESLKLDIIFSSIHIYIQIHCINIQRHLWQHKN